MMSLPSVSIALDSPLPSSTSLAGERGDRLEFPLDLQKAGLVRADVEWAGGDESQLALVVFRKGTPGAYARIDGTAPHLRLYWTLPPGLAARTPADEGRLAVVNLQAAPVNGEVSVQMEPLPSP